MDNLILCINEFVFGTKNKIIDDWLQKNMNTEIKYNIDSKCQNITYNNYGTIFYYACVTDNHELLQYIVDYANLYNIIIDINYRNKDLNNDACILHVMKFGYTECLNILLTIPTINYYIINEHITFTLGQTITLRDAGKQNILFIALENNNYDCLNILFSKTDKEITDILLSQTNYYDESFEFVLRKKYTIFTSYNKNTNLLTELIEFTNTYFPKIHILNIIDDYDALHKKQQLQLQKINTTSSVDNLHVAPNSTISLALYAQISTFEHNVTEYDTLCSNVHKLKTQLPKAYCDELLTAFRDYKSNAITNNYPIYIRHDNNMGALDKCGFDAIINKFICLVNKFLKTNNISNITQQCTSCFLIENFVGVEKSFAIHKDDSDFTFNLCLEKSDILHGSEVNFYDDNSNIEYIYNHTIGSIMIHPGNKLHKANNIKTGVRSSLIIWTKNVNC